jgi:hypothetical protein
MSDDDSEWEMVDSDPEGKELAAERSKKLAAAKDKANKQDDENVRSNCLGRRDEGKKKTSSGKENSGKRSHRYCV